MEDFLEQREEGLSSRTSKVLIVDDTPNNLLAFEAILNGLDAQTYTASCGREAVDLARRHEFAVILMDVMMPGIDGFETARLIRDRTRSMESPLIFITAYSSNEGHTAEGYGLGAVDYLYKPVAADILKSKVKVFVELYKQRELIRQKAIEESRQRWEIERLRAQVEREKSISETLTLFRLFVEDVKDYAIFMLDCKGRVLNWNVAAERILGYHESEIVGCEFALIFSPEDIAAGVPAAEMERAKLQGRAKDTRWHRRKDGSLFWADGVVTPLNDSNGQLRGYCKLLRDATERKHWEESLEKTARELQRSNQELQEFAYLASHDLKEPLRTIGAHLSLVARKHQDKLDPSSNESLKFAVNGAQRMQALIDGLLTFAQVNAADLQCQEVDLNQLTKMIQADLKISIEENQAALEIAPLPKVFGYPTQLEQLLQNLVSNALKFRGNQPPLIRIDCQPDKSHWIFSVKDNGIGFDMRFSERVFEIFRRLHGKLEYPGSGIGLALCRKIVERHGGRIWVESEPNKGSNFLFTLPMMTPA